MSDVISSLPDDLRKQLRKGVQPAWVDPMLATLTLERFSRPGWIFEPKFDGERCLAFKRGKVVRLLSRNGKSINGSYPEIAEALERQNHDFILDGEVVAFERTVTSFAKLQGRMQTRDPQEARHSGISVYYYIFDLLYLDGYDFRNLELIQRKKLLRQYVEFKEPLRFTSHRDAEGESYYQEACKKDWQGLIAKRADGPYLGKRSSDWLKFKCVSEQELVIGGYTEPQGERFGFGALLVGFYEKGKLIYAGKVGTGYDEKTLRGLSAQLLQLEQSESPFAEEIKEKRVHWVKPHLVALVGFSEWTSYGKLRHPRFLGLRRDKKPAEVVREERDMENSIRLDGHSIELSHVDKLLFPEDEISKGELIEYYRKIGKVMLPYLFDRPLVMHRFPEGIHKEGFIQQKVSDYFPEWIDRVSVKKEGGSLIHAVCQNPATLVYLANQACITFHVWLSRRDRLLNPDQLIFDLDPGAKDFGSVREAALLLRGFFNKLDLEPLVKTTGSSGLHVMLPLDRSASFDEVRAFARNVAEFLSEGESIVTAEQRKDKRKGRILLDYVRNSYGQTVVAPYAVRAKPGAPIATPLDWDELSNPKLASQSYNTKNIFQRLSRKKDPWEGNWRKGHSLARIQKKLDSMKKDRSG